MAAWGRRVMLLYGASDSYGGTANNNMMVLDADDLGAERVGAKRMLDLLEAAVPRPVRATGAPVEIIVRRDDKHVYVTLINPDLKQAACATVHLADTYTMAVDRGIERGFAVPLRKAAEGQAFGVQLAPGEGTLVELTPSAGRAN